MKESFAIFEKGRIDQYVDELRLHKGELLAFLEEKATDPRDSDAKKYEICYEQLLHDGKISWTNMTVSMYAQIQKLPLIADSIHRSREILDEAFFENHDYDPLFHLAKHQEINADVLNRLRENPQDPSEEFVALFKSELVKRIRAISHPLYISSYENSQHVISSLEKGETVSQISVMVNDTFYGLCKFYRLDPDFTEKLEKKIRWNTN